MTETQHNLIETRVKEFKGSLQNRQALRRTLTGLFERSQVGNRAYYELEDRWGFVGSYDCHDDNYPNDLTQE